MQALKKYSEPKQPERVGQIFIIGNEKTGQQTILKQVPLFPGQVFTPSDLSAAERNLSRLKSANIDVIKSELSGVFKDVRIEVEEK